MSDYDVLVVGAGPVGAALALALSQAGLSLAVVEPRPPGPAQPRLRPIALSWASRLLLERLALWEDLAPATPIERVHVSQRGGLGRLEFDARSLGLPALGYVVGYGSVAMALRKALRERAGHCLIEGEVVELVPGRERACVRLRRGGRLEQAAARLVAVADGGAAELVPARTRAYGQGALFAQVRSSEPHRHVAYERFCPEGPLALLPWGDELALIWSTSVERAARLCALPEREFLGELGQAFGPRLGRFLSCGPRSWGPLALRVARERALARVVAIGNAAQALHPVAGQGLNLGLRDAWELAEAIRDCEPRELGAAAMLQAYRGRRCADRRFAIGFTDFAVRVFSNDVAPLRLARGLGLLALSAAPPAARLLARRLSLGARG